MRIIKVLSNIRYPWRYINALNKTQFSKFLPDRLVVSCHYRESFGKSLNLRNPKTYNEKLQWLKLYDRNPYYSKLVDKYEVKSIIAQKIGIEHVIPTYGVWEHQDDIDFDSLPDTFVLKTTHDSHSIVICNKKSELDILKAKEELGKSLAHNYYYGGREWPYKNVKPRIIAEKLMVDETFHELRDYKFFCFDGVPKAMYIATERYNPNKPTAFDFFDMDYNHLPIIQGHPNSEIIPEKPVNFEKMKEMSCILSNGIPQVRIDFYEINGAVFFGEITFFHFSGFVPFEPNKWDLIFGSWIRLPQK